jgi:hypothetical protein
MILADLVLCASCHFCIAGFITAGCAMIPFGAGLGWRWVPPQPR